MKKSIIAIIIVAILALTLVACGEFTKDSKTIYDTLNDMVDMDYQRVNLEVQTTMSGVTLVNNFTSTKGTTSTVISYSVQELATFDIIPGGNEYEIPSEMIVKKTGTAIVQNGKIIEQNGDSVDISVVALQDLTINFKREYFNMAQETYEGGADVFKAEVINAKGFTGNANFNGTNMKITVRYGTALKSIIIDYVSDQGAQVKVIYNFG
jgi:hypothetical protein